MISQRKYPAIAGLNTFAPTDNETSRFGCLFFIRSKDYPPR